MTGSMLNVVLFGFLAVALAQPYRPFDGVGNNVANPNRGAASTNYIRQWGSGANGPNPALSSITGLPGARNLSILLFGQEENIFNSRGIAVFLPWFGNFIAHDTCMSPANASDPFPIPLQRGDPDYDPFNTGGNPSAPLSRLQRDAQGRPVNLATSYLDLSQLYGLSDTECRRLRSFVDGKLNMTCPPGPANVTASRCIIMTNWKQEPFLGLPNTERFFLTGDMRNNLSPSVMAITILFAREHNRRCDELKQRFPHWDDEKLFQEARHWTIAVYQHIAVDEYLPALTGFPLPLYTGYDPEVDASTDIFFAAVAFRYGHAALTQSIPRVDENYRPMQNGPFSIRQGFLNPNIIKQDGTDCIFRGILTTPEQEIKVHMVPDMRFLPLVAFDMASINVQRGRELGIPSYKAMLDTLGQTPVATFDDATRLDPAIRETLKQQYGNDINKLDAYIGGLAEAPDNPSTLGPLFAATIRDQFTRFRSGDRFWWENKNLNLFNDTDRKNIKETNLAKLVVRNSDVKFMPAAGAFVNFFPDLTQPFGGLNETKEGSVRGFLTLMSGYDLAFGVDDNRIVIRMTCPPDIRAGVGFCGLGFGVSDMIGADIITCHLDADGVTGACEDRMGDNRNYPYNDLYYSEGRNDVQDLKIINTGGRITFSWTRLLDTKDPYDRVIIPNANTEIIFSASSNTPGPAYGEPWLNYHSTRRGKGKVNFLAGVGIVGYNTVEAVRYTHGIMMIATWLFFYPSGVFVARYFKYKNWWISLHGALQKFGAMGSISFAILAWWSNDRHWKNVHSVLGTFVIIFLAFQMGLGFTAKFRLGRVGQAAWLQKFFKLVPLIHIVLGSSLIIVGPINVYYGMDILLFPDYPQLKILYWVMISVILGAFITADSYLYYNTVLQANKVKNGETAANWFLIGMSQIEALPKFTWTQFSERVKAGNKYIVIRGVVYDMRKWATSHPGGVKVLNDAIGTDATVQFLGKHARAQNTDKRALRVSHTHSPFAWYKLPDLAVAVIASEYAAHVANAAEQADLEGKAQGLAAQYRSYQLKEIIDLTKGVSNPVKLYRFDLGSQGHGLQWTLFKRKSEAETKLDIEANNSIMRMVPGHHLVMQAIINDEVVERPYTPKPTESDQYFDLVIKQYGAGLMTGRYLRNLTVGDFVKFRGPEGPNLLNPARLNQSSASEAAVDGTWPYVAMIAAGSGVTPMFQLIDYHLSHNQEKMGAGKKNLSRFGLLCCNRTAQDIIMPDEMDKWVTEGKGQFTLTHALSQETDSKNNKYKLGRLTPDLIQEFLSFLPKSAVVPGAAEERKASSKLIDLEVHEARLPKFSRGASTLIGSDKEAKRNTIKSSGGGTINVAGKVDGVGTPQPLPKELQMGSIQVRENDLGTPQIGSLPVTTSTRNLMVGGIQGDPQDGGQTPTPNPASSPLRGNAFSLARQAMNNANNAAASASGGRTRREAATNLVSSLPEEEHFRIIVCGPYGFMKSVLAMLLDLGYPEDSVEILT